MPTQCLDANDYASVAKSGCNCQNRGPPSVLGCPNVVQKLHDDDEEDACNASCQHHPVSDDGSLSKKQYGSDHDPCWCEILKPNGVGRRSIRNRCKEGPVHSNEAQRHWNHSPMQGRFPDHRQKQPTGKEGSPKCNHGATRFAGPTIEQSGLSEKTVAAPKDCGSDDQ